jgi:hypothetical protein
MISSRVLLFVAVVCIGFAAWTIHLHPMAAYEIPVGDTTASSLATTSCSSVWDRWTNDVPPSPVPLPKSLANVEGPTNADLKAAACSATVVGHEHISETWAAGALVALLAAAFCFWQFED